MKEIQTTKQFDEYKEQGIGPNGYRHLIAEIGRLQAEASDSRIRRKGVSPPKIETKTIFEIYHGLNKLVTDLSNKEHDDNEQEMSEMQFEDSALKTECTCFCRGDQRSKQNHKDEILASPSTRTLPIGERKWTDVEPEDYSHIAYPVSNDDCLLFFVMVSYLENKMKRWNSGNF